MVDASARHFYNLLLDWFYPLVLVWWCVVWPPALQLIFGMLGNHKIILYLILYFISLYYVIIIHVARLLACSVSFIKYEG